MPGTPSLSPALRHTCQSGATSVRRVPAAPANRSSRSPSLKAALQLLRIMWLYPYVELREYLSRVSIFCLSQGVYYMNRYG